MRPYERTTPKESPRFDGVQLTVRQVVVLFCFGAVCVPFVLTDTNGFIAVVVLNFLHYFAGGIIVGRGNAASLTVGSVLDLLDAASLRVIYFHVVEPAGLGFGVGVPFLDGEVLPFLPFRQLFGSQ